MARLPKGVTPEPRAENRARNIKKLLDSGGRRMVLELDSHVNEALENLLLHFSLSHEGKAPGYQDTIRRALVEYSAHLGPAPANAVMPKVPRAGPRKAAQPSPSPAAQE